MKFQDHEVVVLKIDFFEYNLEKGYTGTILECFEHPDEAYLVEFSDNTGEAVCTEIFKAGDLGKTIKYKPTKLKSLLND